jgi:hypothetical protein
LENSSPLSNKLSSLLKIIPNILTFSPEQKRKSSKRQKKINIHTRKKKINLKSEKPTEK